ncbi:putative membrane protein [Clostridioides difficile P37]|nr:putative membrane protein [Clostridioides difficile P37]
MRPSKKLLIAIISIFLISSVPVSAHQIVLLYNKIKTHLVK